MCKLAQVIRYTVLSENFHFGCFRAMAYIRLWNWVQFCLFNALYNSLGYRRSHDSAMHTNKADFDPPGGQNPWTNFDETWHGSLRPGPQPTWQHWGGSSTWVVSAHTWLVESRSFFAFFSFFFSFFFFAFFATRPGRISWPMGTIYTSKRVFPAKDVPFGGLDNIWPHSGGQIPKKPPNFGISGPPPYLWNGWS